MEEAKLAIPLTNGLRISYTQRRLEGGMIWGK